MLADRTHGLKLSGLPPVLLLTDEVRLADPFAVLDRLPPGAGVVFRHYGVAGREEMARLLLAACRARKLVMLVAGDMAMAARIKADGTHLPEYLAGRIAACGKIRRPWPGFLLTAAAHGLKGLVAAERLGADAALLSPVFATASHPGKAALGPWRFARLVRRAGLPVYALGGVTPANFRRLHPAHPAGFAGIGGINA